MRSTEGSIIIHLICDFIGSAHLPGVKHFTDLLNRCVFYYSTSNWCKLSQNTVLFFPRDPVKIGVHNSKQYTNLEKLSPLVRSSAFFIAQYTFESYERWYSDVYLKWHAALRPWKHTVSVFISSAVFILFTTLLLVKEDWKTFIFLLISFYSSLIVVPGLEFIWS